VRFGRLTVAAVVITLAAAVLSPCFANSLDKQLRGFYGFDRPMSITESDKTVGTTAVQLYPGDPSTAENIISVTGANACAIGHTGAVTTTTGILLGASGGNYSDDWLDDDYLPGLEMWAICAGAGTTIHITKMRFQ